MFEVKFTGDRVTAEMSELGVSESGWIDPQWSKRELYENSEDARTFEADTLEEAVELIESYIGSVCDNGDGSYYSEDSEMDIMTGDVWTYAGHITEV